VYTAAVVTVALQPLMVRAHAALERGRGADAVEHLAPALRSTALTREDEFALRIALAEAWFLQDDVDQASAVLGRPPDTLREPVPAATLAHLWRLHGRVAQVRGEQSRAIALHQRALRHAELAHDARAIGLARFELARCYKQLGEAATMREHFAEAASALHAVGDRRSLALVHSLSGSALAQAGRFDEALTALRQAERFAAGVHADDVLAIVYGNQANVAMMRHRYDQALALAEQSVGRHEQFPPGYGLAVALATLGQICIRLGTLDRAERALRRALEIKRGLLFHETTGAIFDSLAQIHLIRGEYDQVEESLDRAREAYGAYDAQTPRWYDWSLRLLAARLALRRGLTALTIERCDAVVAADGAPPPDVLQAHVIALEALLEAGHTQESERRIANIESRIDARTTPGAWGEFLRSRGEWHAQMMRASEAYHDLAQSSTVFELLGERYEAARSHLALGRLAARAGARPLAERYLRQADDTFAALGARPDIDDVSRARALLALPGTGAFIGSAADADDALVRRLVDAAALPELLSRETLAALIETAGGHAGVLYARSGAGEVSVLAASGLDAHEATALAAAAAAGEATRADLRCVDVHGGANGATRHAVVAGGNPGGDFAERRQRVVLAVARQGFDLCAARERPLPAAAPSTERGLEPLVPGFLCASAAMRRVTDQIARLQGNELTVLITGESGTGKELVARAIHAGSLRRTAVFLPYNCTTTTRDLADSQLFGHRRGSFTGAVADQQGLVRAAAHGTLFLDEIGDLPLDVQPKLLRFLEQGEIMPVGDTRPLKVDVRVIAATNADLEQRVAQGRFREDLYYRLSVLRIRVPPLRERREEIPHLAMYFLREACERLARPDVDLSAGVLELFSQYPWPGNVRQLRNEVQRAVALTGPGRTITPDVLSPEFGRLLDTGAMGMPTRSGQPVSLAAAVDQLERDLIAETLGRTKGNISEAARALGLTRRGLYLKLRRLGLEQRLTVDTN
jgi:hydrogenase-4 transcriptional activator